MGRLQAEKNSGLDEIWRTEDRIHKLKMKRLQVNANRTAPPVTEDEAVSKQVKANARLQNVGELQIRSKAKALTLQMSHLAQLNESSRHRLRSLDGDHQLILTEIVDLTRELEKTRRRRVRLVDKLNSDIREVQSHRHSSLTPSRGHREYHSEIKV